MTQVIETLPHEEQGVDYYISAIAADVLATQGARDKAAMLLTEFITRRVITVTSQWTPWRPKSPAPRLFA